LFGQTKFYYDILPSYIEARPLLDSLSSLPDSLKLPVFNILKSNGFDLTKCFVDRKMEVNENNSTISIRIWDIDDLVYRKKREKSHKNIQYQHTHPDFYSGGIIYNFKTGIGHFYSDQ
jgi:hypothetical protein